MAALAVAIRVVPARRRAGIALRLLAWGGIGYAAYLSAIHTRAYPPVLYQNVMRYLRPTPCAVAIVTKPAEGDLLLYRRESGETAVVIALNLGAEPVSIKSDAAGLSGEILLSTFLDRQGEKIQGALDLRGDEGVMIGTSLVP